MNTNNNNNNNNNNKSQDSKSSVGLSLPDSKKQKVTATASGKHCRDLLKKKVLKGDVKKFLIVDSEEGKNKNKKNTVRGRHFQLTYNYSDDNNNYKDIKSYLRGVKYFKYLISCHEIAPTTGKKHYHIYIQYEKRVEISLKKLYGAHIEVCRGDAVSNKKYIEKKEHPQDFIVDEIGEFDDMVGVQGGKTRFPTIEEVKKMDPSSLEKLPLQYYNIVEKIKSKRAQQITIEEFNKWPVTVYYICGESGVGKTRMAQNIIKSWGSHFNNIKYENTFWMGVTEGCQIALYDDWRDSHMKPSELINFIDYNVHIMNIKGGYIKNLYKKIVITSIQHWDYIYKGAREKDEELPQQWERRMKKIFINNNYKKYISEGASKLEKILKNPLSPEEEKESIEKEKMTAKINTFYLLLNYKKIEKKIEEGYSLSPKEAEKEIKNLLNIPASGDHIEGFN